MPTIKRRPGAPTKTPTAEDIKDQATPFTPPSTSTDEQKDRLPDPIQDLLDKHNPPKRGSEPMLPATNTVGKPKRPTLDDDDDDRFEDDGKATPPRP